jgi:hypothetical protein
LATEGGRWLWIDGWGVDPRTIEIVPLGDPGATAAIDSADADRCPRHPNHS